LQTSVPEYELIISSQSLAKFEADPYADEEPAIFRYQGKEHAVRVRLRGSTARFFPKKSWRVDFGEGQRFEGRRKLNFIAEYQDSTMFTEKLAYDLLEALDVPSPRAKYARLRINGQYQGVFLDLERVDNRFLEAHAFLDENASIYRCGHTDCEMKLWRMPYQGPFLKKTNEEEKRDELPPLLQVINRAPEARLAQELEKVVELERYLRVMAMESLISNNITQDSKSYWILDRVTKKWLYVPWDMNNADARWWPSYELGMKPVVKHPLFIFSAIDEWVATMWERRKEGHEDYLPAFSNLNTRIAFNRELRLRAVRVTQRALDEVFNEDVMHPRIEAMYQLIAPHMAQDPYIDQAKFKAGRQFMKDYVTQRSAFVRDQLRALESRGLGLAISAFSPNGQWIELTNYGTEAATTEGLVLTTNLRRALTRNVPARTLAPRENVTFAAQQLGLVLPAEGELGLYNGVSVAGALDVIFYGTLTPPATFHARDAEDPHRWTTRSSDVN
jgi:spore coat protein H